MVILVPADWSIRWYIRGTQHTATFTPIPPESMNFELLDDQLASAALQDALAFIDAYERSAAVRGPTPILLPADHAPVQAEPTGQTRVRSRQTNRNRGAQKSELTRLRHDVKLLETKLAQLKNESEHQRPYDSPGSTSDASSSSSANTESSCSDGAITATWKPVALRQYHRRIHAESVNQKLKQVLAKQLKVANALHTIFLRRTAQDVSLFLLYVDAQRAFDV